MEKLCSKCKVSKSVECFSRNKARHDGLAVWCKECTGAYSRERNKRPEIKKKLAEQALARYHALPEDKKHEYNTRMGKTDAALRRKYGKSLAWYEQTLAEQGGGCAICGAKPSKRRLHVDHDHNCCAGENTCGRCVRGLLCVTCNTQLATLEKKDGWLEKAAAYVAA